MISSEINYKLRGYAVSVYSLESHKFLSNYLTDVVEYLFQLMAFANEDPKIKDFFYSAQELEQDAKVLDEKVRQLLNDLKDEIKNQGGDYGKLLEQEDSLRRQDDEREDT